MLYQLELLAYYKICASDRKGKTFPPDATHWHPTPNHLIFLYFVSLWGVCFPQNLQYFLNSNLCVVVFLFFVLE
jgi:hypothetical protein